MKHFLTLIFTALLVLATFSSPQAMTIIDGDHTLGLYGIQWETGIDKSTRFPDAILGNLPEIILENDYLDGTLGGTGFILVANWWEETKKLTLDIDYAGVTQHRFVNADLDPTYISTVGDWTTWWISYTFTGGTVLNEITRMFAEINYGETYISEEITLTSTTPTTPILVFSLYENLIEETPFRSGTHGIVPNFGMQSIGYLEYTDSAFWKDFQGLFYLEVLTGTIELESISAATIVNSSLYKQSFSVPIPNSFIFVLLGFF